MLVTKGNVVVLFNHPFKALLKMKVSGVPGRSCRDGRRRSVLRRRSASIYRNQDELNFARELNFPRRQPVYMLHRVGNEAARLAVSNRRRVITHHEVLAAMFAIFSAAARARYQFVGVSDGG
ncbi:hypothetical protein AALO_G00287410 [Alosa alosa]|uniref:Uncharacterized protein n=1 Tax=Alosa alosa TaxID=278164 RepID=A0AAV6FFX7_9TELE|nr:hypothetical protein AALO_G00287410 [Alosa alosa]